MQDTEVETAIDSALRMKKMTSDMLTICANQAKTLPEGITALTSAMIGLGEIGDIPTSKLREAFEAVIQLYDASNITILNVEDK
jgi:hypothetical protein